MDYTDSTDSMDSYFITDPGTYTELLTCLIEQLKPEEKGNLPDPLKNLLNLIAKDKSLEHAKLIISYFLNNLQEYAGSTVEAIAFFLDTAFFRACKVLYDRGLISAGEHGELNFTAILTHKKISDLIGVISILDAKGILSGVKAQKNFDLIMRHRAFPSFCSALFEGQTSFLQHKVIRDHFEWITGHSKPAYLIRALSILDDAQLITRSNCELLIHQWSGNLRNYVSLLKLFHHNELLDQANFIKIMDGVDPFYLFHALHSLCWLFRTTKIPPILLDLLLEHCDPIELSEAIQILGRKSLLFKIRINGKYAEEYLALHPAPRKLAEAFVILFKAKAITKNFLQENIVTVINHPEPYFATYNVYLISRAGLLNPDTRQLAAEHRDDAAELFSILDILTKKRMVRDTAPHSPLELMSQLLAHKQIKELSKCLGILYSSRLIKSNSKAALFHTLLQHPDLEHFSEVLNKLKNNNLLIPPLSLPTGNHIFWRIAKHQEIQSLSSSVSILWQADLLDQPNMDTLLAHKKPVSFARALKLLEKFFAVDYMLLPGHFYEVRQVNKNAQVLFNDLAVHPHLNSVSKIFEQLSNTALFHGTQGMANVGSIIKSPHTKILLKLVSLLNDKGMFHKSGAQCFFDAVMRHPNPFYLYETFSSLMDLKGMNKLTAKEAFIRAMKQTGFTFNKAQMIFSKNTNTLFQPTSKPKSLAQIINEECILPIITSGYS